MADCVSDVVYCCLLAGVFVSGFLCWFVYDRFCVAGGFGCSLLGVWFLGCLLL